MEQHILKSYLIVEGTSEIQIFYTNLVKLGVAYIRLERLELDKYSSLLSPYS